MELNDDPFVAEHLATHPFAIRKATKADAATVGDHSDKIMALLGNLNAFSHQYHRRLRMLVFEGDAY